MARVSAWRRWRRRFWAEAARGVLAAGRSWPPSVSRAICGLLALLAPMASPRAARRAWRHLGHAYPGRSVAWRFRVWSGLVASLGRCLHGALTAPRALAAGFPGVTVEPGPGGMDLLATLRERAAGGQGAFLLTGHLGCWELLGAWLAHHLGGLAVVTATVHNAEVDRMLQDHRRSLAMRPLPREGGARPILRALDGGEVVGVLLDQATGAHSVALPFFGRPAPTPVGIARLARRRGVALVPAAMVWGRGAWRVRCLAPLEPADHASDADLAAACNGALQTLIEGNPEQWVWFHERWPDPRT